MAGIKSQQSQLIIPGGEARAEIVIDKSRFITCCGPAFSVEEARAYIQKIRTEFPDATHHVPTFIIGHGAGVTMHCSDDGEPSGTAGRPALAVLQGSGLGDAVAVVTRYFGGIKLGTGGLVRAYSNAIRSVLGVLPRAEKVATSVAMTVIPYNLLELVRLLITETKGVLLDEEYAGEITLTIRFRDEQVDLFTGRLNDLSRGAVNVIIVERQSNTIMPL
jgi:uncharacterized YigZ family protein